MIHCYKKAKHRRDPGSTDEQFTHIKKSHLGHLADVLELSINLREGTTFYVINSRHNDSLLRFCACLPCRDVAQVAESTSLHEA